MKKISVNPLPVEIPFSDDFAVYVTFDDNPNFDSNYILYCIADYDTCVDVIVSLERA